ncbi:metal-dependent transcriptional regulator [Pseudodesulfovibrio alkaliphilus]|nr:metal-dependent transcriptional regulator [Pseudodesulfovibrio alkaliphilus]
MPRTTALEKAADRCVKQGALMTSQHKEEQQLSPVQENYLEAIFRIETRDGAARASTIAEAVQVSRSTVTGALKTLNAMGYVEYSPYSLIYLTDKGKDVGRRIAHRHFVFLAFLEKVLYLDPEEADKTACALEHVVSDDIVKRLGEFVLFLKSCPEFWTDWLKVYKRNNLLEKSHTSATIAEVLGTKPGQQRDAAPQDD